MNKGLAECAGLWLAEGDQKTIREITFTNNELSLVKLFHHNLQNTFDLTNLCPRIYVYSAKGAKLRFPKMKINYYTDKRARKPYFLYRVASRNLVQEWKKIVEGVLGKEEFYADILRGFFAGEGNIKTGSHSNRTVRISQKKRIDWVEEILKSFELPIKFSQTERSYIITGRKNLEKLNELKIAELHPLKKKKFEALLDGFKEHHYPSNYLKNQVFGLLDSPKTCKELGKNFDRSPARVLDVLEELKREKRVIYYRAKSIAYWIKTSENSVILSNQRKQVLDLTDIKHVSEIAKELSVNYKTIFKILKGLEKLGLVKKTENGWVRMKSNKKVIVC